MRVLGIDPGYAIVGWGVVEYISNRFAPIGYGAVITEKDTPFEQRWLRTARCTILPCIVCWPTTSAQW